MLAVVVRAIIFYLVIFREVFSRFNQKRIQQMNTINTPPEGKGNITLRARSFIKGTYSDCIVIEADSETQTAKVIARGSLFITEVTFQSIANVALVYDDGTILQSFGAPRISNPASLAYIATPACVADREVRQ